MKAENILRKVLHDNHSKVTPARLLVFKLLLNQPPRSLADLTKLSGRKVDRVTVYRTIDLFEKLGIIRRVTIGWKYKVELSEIFLDHHHHIVCINCNKVVAIEQNDEIEIMLRNLTEKSGFTSSSHQLELQGYCPGCQKLSLSK